MKRIFVCMLIVLAVMMSPVLRAGDVETDRAVADISTGEIMDTIEYLASKKFEGRLTGTSGFKDAADFVAGRFRIWGVSSPDGGYLQDYPVTTAIIREAALSFQVPGKDGEPVATPCRLEKDFFPFGFSGGGEVSAPVVFVGYGMTVPEYGVDDYAGVDVKGKIALILKGAPEAKDGEDWTDYDSHRFRTRNAYEHGAAAVLYVYAPMGNPNGDLIEGFPIIQVTDEIAEQILANDLKIKQLKTLLNKRTRLSFETDASATVSVTSERVDGTGHNVVGVIPGRDPELASQAVVIGAHLDHCGAWPVLMPGADDNASGSAAVMAMARAAASAGVQAKRPLVFVLFGGEEMGLLGSRHFVENLPHGIETVHYCLNLDMVGAGEKVFVLGLKQDNSFHELMTAVHEELDLPFLLTGNERIGGWGSDHGPFISKGWPAVSVFSSGGDHHGYHTPADTPYWITPLISRDISRLILVTAIRLANQ